MPLGAHRGAAWRSRRRARWPRTRNSPRPRPPGGADLPRSRHRGPRGRSGSAPRPTASFQYHPSFPAPPLGPAQPAPEPEMRALRPVHRVPRVSAARGPPRSSSTRRWRSAAGCPRRSAWPASPTSTSCATPSLGPRRTSRAPDPSRSSRCPTSGSRTTIAARSRRSPSVPQHRLEMRVGKLSTVDLFDINPAGTDSHLQFMNWTVDNNGAYDYAADTRGYTLRRRSSSTGAAPRGALRRDADADGRERHRPRLRPRARAAPRTSSSRSVRRCGRAGAASLRAARLRRTTRTWATTARRSPRLQAARRRSPDIAAARAAGRTSTASALNVEQELGPTSRARSCAPAGTTARTRRSRTPRSTTPSSRRRPRAACRWRRPDDRSALAFVTNGLSRDHRDYLALAALGLPARRRRAALRPRDDRRALLQRARLARRRSPTTSSSSTTPATTPIAARSGCSRCAPISSSDSSPANWG